MAGSKSINGEHVSKTRFGFCYMNLCAESKHTMQFLVSVLHAGCPPSTQTNSSAAHKCSIPISHINHKSSLSMVAITFPLQTHFPFCKLFFRISRRWGYKMTTCSLSKSGLTSCFISLRRPHGFHISAALWDPLLPVGHLIPTREHLSSSKSFQNKSLHKQISQNQTNMCLHVVSEEHSGENKLKIQQVILFSEIFLCCSQRMWPLR